MRHWQRAPMWIVEEAFFESILDPMRQIARRHIPENQNFDIPRKYICIVHRTHQK
jgi:hypothetical protein